VSLRGPRRSWEEDREQRTYRCRRCGRREQDFYLPAGWLQVRVRNSGADRGDHTYAIVGMYDTAVCLAADARSWAGQLAHEPG
jgi:hypothetical protein